MSPQSRVQILTAAFLALSSAACATASNPWAAHDLTADYKASVADGDRMCPVVVHNGTDQLIEALVDLDGVDRNLGLLATGQSVTVNVACSARRVHARAVGQDLGPREGAQFRKSAVLDILRETSLRFTLADQVRG